MNTIANRRASALPALALLFSTAAGAQTLSELDRLIFEPVPLSGSEESAPPPTPEQREVRLSLTPPPGAEVLPNGLLPNALQPAALGPLTADASSAPPAPVIDDESGVTTKVYEEVIEEIVIEDGPYTPELVQELLALGELYQQQGKHEEALDVFSRSSQLARVNTGLDSLEQIPGIENMIESLVVLGRLDEADEKHDYMVYLHEQHYGSDDPRIIPSLLKLADWHMQAFQKNVHYEAEGMLIAHSSGASTEKGVRRDAFHDLAQAQGAYLRAIRILVEGNRFQDPQLIELEKRLIEIYFLHAHRRSILEDPENYLNVQRTSTGSLIRHRPNRSNSAAYHFGTDGYTRIMAYQLHNPNTGTLEYARTLMELGDWYLLFSRRAVAQEKYQKAYDLLLAEGFAPEDIAELIRPEVPLTLPTFTPTAHTREMLLPADADIDWRGYIDLSFTINDYGKASDIETLEKSPNTSVSVERRLTRLVRQSQYRPRFTEEGLADDEVRLRYYYSY